MQKFRCDDISCPERRGDACKHDLEGTMQNMVRDFTSVTVRSKGEVQERILDYVAEELRQIRNEYEYMESLYAVDTFESPHRVYVTWRGWKWIRNVISDRIEYLTGDRV